MTRMFKTMQWWFCMITSSHTCCYFGILMVCEEMTHSTPGRAFPSLLGNSEWKSWNLLAWKDWAPNIITDKSNQHHNQYIKCPCLIWKRLCSQILAQLCETLHSQNFSQDQSLYHWCTNHNICQGLDSQNRPNYSLVRGSHIWAAKLKVSLYGSRAIQNPPLLIFSSWPAVWSTDIIAKLKMLMIIMLQLTG